jgi:hypothetical protein
MGDEVDDDGNGTMSDDDDGDGVTGDEVDDDGNDDNCGDVRRRGRWRRRNDINSDSATGNEVDNDGDGAKGDDRSVRPTSNYTAGFARPLDGL